MRQAFAHQAVVEMPSGADLNAPGAAVTVALCGHWDHPPPCPDAPHHTAATRTSDGVRLRILFATEPSEEPAVRRRIEEALRGGWLRGPDGSITRWRLLSSEASPVTAAETGHGARLAEG
ncbi:hypothetical protein [Parafrankia sp. EUN1f]|uniref:hypothetical protein n=1 Tax=Parafrankia sp. EUN1f TaxID=102897 RepID=UPI0001C4783F|nr:hypothetical protein [Parafrankia sp. EUN1f]EFC79388.1 hypothetical protein FrEUN1fDRAFT_7487 [Parafrankia sp. EUN1f]